jgi:hypothetical protein
MNYGAGTLNSLSQDLTHRPTSVKSTLIVIFYGNRIPKKGKPMLALKLSIAILFTLLMPLKKRAVMLRSSGTVDVKRVMEITLGLRVSIS